MTLDSIAIEGGFQNPVFDAQTIFRAVMQAMAEPGTIHKGVALARPPAPLTPELPPLRWPFAIRTRPSGSIRFWRTTMPCAPGSPSTPARPSPTRQPMRISSFPPIRNT